MGGMLDCFFLVPLALFNSHGTYCLSEDAIARKLGPKLLAIDSNPLITRINAVRLECMNDVTDDCTRTRTRRFRQPFSTLR